ncbi:hypothetical protein Droror1_Dr00001104 [Drosera rotundifolia]
MYWCCSSIYHVFFTFPCSHSTSHFSPHQLHPPQNPFSSPPPSAAGRRRSPSQIPGLDDLRRETRRKTIIRFRKLNEGFFFRLKKPHKIHTDNFIESELQMMGFGYDRLVRSMEKDDERLKHPWDLYKYGEFGPYSWRGIVVGEPVRGMMSDECVTMFGEVKDHEEWEKIEQHEMAVEYGKRKKMLDKKLGLRYFWVFVRHSKWRVNESPWE